MARAQRTALESGVQARSSLALPTQGWLSLTGPCGDDTTPALSLVILGGSPVRQDSFRSSAANAAVQALHSCFRRSARSSGAPLPQPHRPRPGSLAAEHDISPAQRSLRPSGAWPPAPDTIIPRGTDITARQPPAGRFHRSGTAPARNERNLNLPHKPPTQTSGRKSPSHENTPKQQTPNNAPPRTPAEQRPTNNTARKQRRTPDPRSDVLRLTERLSRTSHQHVAATRRNKRQSVSRAGGRTAVAGSPGTARPAWSSGRTRPTRPTSPARRTGSSRWRLRSPAGS